MSEEQLQRQDEDWERTASIPVGGILGFGKNECVLASSRIVLGWGIHASVEGWEFGAPVEHLGSWTTEMLNHYRKFKTMDTLLLG